MPTDEETAGKRFIRVYYEVLKEQAEWECFLERAEDVVLQYRKRARELRNPSERHEKLVGLLIEEVHPIE